MPSFSFSFVSSSTFFLFFVSLNIFAACCLFLASGSVQDKNYILFVGMWEGFFCKRKRIPSFLFLIFRLRLFSSIPTKFGSVLTITCSRFLVFIYVFADCRMPIHIIFFPNWQWRDVLHWCYRVRLAALAGPM